METTAQTTEKKGKRTVAGKKKMIEDVFADTKEPEKQSETRTVSGKKSITKDVFADIKEPEKQSETERVETPFTFHGITMGMTRKEARLLGMNLFGKIAGPQVTKICKAEELWLNFNHEDKLFRFKVCYNAHNEFEEIALTEAFKEKYIAPIGSSTVIHFSNETTLLGKRRVIAIIEDRISYRNYIVWLKNNRFKDI